MNDPRKGRETALLRLDPNATLPPEELAVRIDMFVLEGSFSDGHGTYYTDQGGCTMLIREGDLVW